MSIGIVPVLNLKGVKSRDVLLKLKKEGPYEYKRAKQVTKKDVDEAIKHDEDKIIEIMEELSPVKVDLIKKNKERYEAIRYSDEWLELTNAHKKIDSFNELKKSIGDYCKDEESCDEMIKTLEKTYVSKYCQIISKNPYKSFYQQREVLISSQEYYYLLIVKEIKEYINDLKEYCLQHPNMVKGNRKK